MSSQQSKILKTFTFLVFVFTFVFLLFSDGCTKGVRDPNTIEFWTLQLSPAFDGYINNLIAKFKTTHPGVNVIWVDVPFEGMTQKYLSAIASNTSPDVINLPADYVVKYAQLEALSPLDKVLSDTILAKYLPSAIRPLRVRNSYYGLPWYLATKIVIYDRKKIEEAGCSTDSIPTTFDGLLTFAKRYHKTTGRYAFFYNVAVDSYLFQVLVSEGVQLLTEDGKRAAFNTPHAIRIIEQWVETFQSGAMPRECILSGHRGGIETYQSGSTAMFIGAPQFLRIIRENSPRVYETTDVAPAIVGTTGKTELDAMCLSISSKSVIPSLAAEFAEFITNEENQLQFSRLAPIFPSVRHALQDPFFAAINGTIESKARAIAARQLLHSEVMKPIAKDYQRLQEAFKNQMLKAFLGTTSVARALATAEEQWNNILEEE
jgi:putative chitobiose transport system substrate-binding protein